MKKQLSVGLFSVTLLSGIFYSCTKDIGPNPLLDKNSPYTDKSLLDSCKNSSAFIFYKGSSAYIANDPSSGSPHGPFKLKFNKIAAAALGTDGELPVGATFPEGSMVVKETQASIYAFLYKRNGAWLWGETSFDGSNIIESVNQDASTACISCHNRPVARDLVLSFQFY